MIIDNKFSWIDHVPLVCRKVGSSIGVMIKAARKVLHSEYLKSYYILFIHISLNVISDPPLSDK